MNKTISQDGGMQFRVNHFEFDIDAIKEGIFSITKGLNNESDFIIYGCELELEIVTGTQYKVTEGAVYVDGEIYQFDEQNVGTIDTETFGDNYYFDLLQSYDSDGLVPFLDGTTKNTRQVRKALLTTTPVTFDDVSYDSLTTLYDIITEDQATTTTNGVTRYATTDETKSGSSQLIAVTPYGLAQKLPHRIETINIGTWNMGYTASGGSLSKTVTFADSQFTIDPVKVRSISVIIQNDSGLIARPIDAVNASSEVLGGIQYFDDSIMVLYIKESGTFDSTTFNDDTINRGWITFTIAN